MALAFGEALAALMDGSTVTRSSWDASHSHLELDAGVIVLITNNEDDNRPWVTGSADLLATDWKVL